MAAAFPESYLISLHVEQTLVTYVARHLLLSPVFQGADFYGPVAALPACTERGHWRIENDLHCPGHRA